MAEKKYVYMFSEGNIGMTDLLGGKGAGLAEMKRIGLNVPPGFTITTDACREFMKSGKFPEGMLEQTYSSLKQIESETGKKFGDPVNPLLVSVRSGAPISMPGMMDTILNVGLNDETVKGIAKSTGNERFALDSYRRLIQMFGSVVLNIEKGSFEESMESIKSKYSLKQDIDLKPEHLRELINMYLDIYKKNGKIFPTDPMEQLRKAIEAVFLSWNSDRAVAYREINKIPDDMGTAVTIVSMIFGNMGNDSATGVAFTRDPNTGEKILFAEYLVNAQGEDVVSGVRTPRKISDMKNELPEAYNDLVRCADILEKHYKNMMDIEFTVEKGKLYMLQTRVGKRTARAEIKIAVDMVSEKLIDEKEAVMRITPSTIDTILHPQLLRTGKEKVLGHGLAASPGAAVGTIVFTSDRAVQLAKDGKKVVLVRPETVADDVRGMSMSQGFLTQKGGMTSHAAVVARAMGKPAVVGAEDIKVNVRDGTLLASGVTLREGDTITIDGSTGEFFEGSLQLTMSHVSEDLAKILTWCDKFRKLGVRANANTPEEAVVARENGAEGIGLARTERMFLGNDRIPIMRSMIMSTTSEERKKYLDMLLTMQISDFTEFFRTMDGFPVIVRLLDPPLHEFLPDKETLLNDINTLKSKGIKDESSRKRLQELEHLLSTLRSLEEFNPMLGFRGCRLGITYPEIYEMQVKAILTAARNAKKEGKKILPEIMVPLVGEYTELKILRERLESVAKETLGGDNIEYKIGTMVELPRTCLTADKIARYADFFSFGTNDLTQMTFGFSRDDAESKFMHTYLEKGILKDDPFNTIDREGVGELMRIGVEKGRSVNPTLDIGICGEQGGDPETIYFCHEIGLDYVSSSPYRIPVARLAAARIAIKSDGKGK
ncbi:MAG: pyruvate, phosphate dikinase [Candidatus Thermoplasmatota archaeon]|nr:pyruvate, phosphate dikinase [Candidatus Thermoplasmatota archaeon]